MTGRIIGQPDHTPRRRTLRLPHLDPPRALQRQERLCKALWWAAAAAATVALYAWALRGA